MLASNKGFLLVDSLICVFVVSSICVLCFSIYKNIVNYDSGYDSYQNKSNDVYVSIFNNLDECEGCDIDESD